MKKLTKTTLALLMAVSLTACSGGTPKESVSSEKPKEETPAVTTNSTESTASEASAPESTVTEPVQSGTTPAESEVEEVKEQLKLNITEEGIVKNGSWYFTANNNGTTENYLYNFADKKLVKFDVETGYEVGDISGYGVLLLHEYIDQNRATGKLIEAASNSVLAEDLQFVGDSEDFFVDDTLLVGKHEASFSSATDSIGLMNSSGEWIYPLSSETALNDIEGFDLSSEKCFVFNFGSIGSGYVFVSIDNNDLFYYSLKTNSFVENSGIRGLYLREEDQGYGLSTHNDGMWLYKYDFNTNEMTDIAKCANSRKAFIIADTKNKTFYVYEYGSDHGIAYDTKTDKLTELTNILGEPAAFVNGIVFNKEIIGADEESYFGAYNLNSEFAFEPIRANGGLIVPVGEKVIIKINSPDSALYIFDTASNTLSTVETDDSFASAEFFAGDDDTVVVKKRVDGENTYVLADIDDLTKTYSPFDSQ